MRPFRAFAVAFLLFVDLCRVEVLANRQEQHLQRGRRLTLRKVETAATINECHDTALDSFIRSMTGKKIHARTKQSISVEMCKHCVRVYRNLGLTKCKWCPEEFLAGWPMPSPASFSRKLCYSTSSPRPGCSSALPFARTEADCEDSYKDVETHHGGASYNVPVRHFPLRRESVRGSAERAAVGKLHPVLEEEVHARDGIGALRSVRAA